MTIKHAISIARYSLLFLWAAFFIASSASAQESLPEGVPSYPGATAESGYTIGKGTYATHRAPASITAVKKFFDEQVPPEWKPKGKWSADARSFQRKDPADGHNLRSFRVTLSNKGPKSTLIVYKITAK